jgi:hypothetical protein
VYLQDDGKSCPKPRAEALFHITLYREQIAAKDGHWLMGSSILNVLLPIPGLVKIMGIKRYVIWKVVLYTTVGKAATKEYLSQRAPCSGNMSFISTYRPDDYGHLI